MLYVLYCLDRPNASDLRQAHRPDHIEWAGKHPNIRMAGPLLGDDEQTMIGSLFVIEADNREAAASMNADDPYTRAGLFERVEIHPFRWLLGAQAPQ